MKKKYVSPLAENISLTVEGVIAMSFDKSNDHADGDFQELSNKKKSTIWKNQDSAWK